MKKTLNTAAILKFLALLASILLSINMEAKGKIKNEFGGNIGLSINKDNIYVNIAPQFGWQFAKFFSAGLDVNYTYNSSKNSSYKVSSNYLGAGIYAKFTIVRYIELFARPEAYYGWFNAGEYSKEKFIPTVVLGGGLRLPTGNIGAISVNVYYDVVQDSLTPYGSSIGYSVGYTFAF